MFSSCSALALTFADMWSTPHPFADKFAMSRQFYTPFLIEGVVYQSFDKDSLSYKSSRIVDKSAGHVL